MPSVRAHPDARDARFRPAAARLGAVPLARPGLGLL